MKILIFISQLNKGGAERVVANLSNYLINNHDVTIAVLRNRNIEYSFDKRITIINLEDIIVNNKSKLSKFIVRYNNYVRLIKNNSFDIILSFLPAPSFIALFCKKESNARIIVSVRNDPKNEYKSLFRKILVKLLYNKADGFVFQTNEAKDFFSQKIQNKSKIIMNSISSEFICERFKGEREKIIVSVGRLEKQKNHLLLIKAFYEIKNLIPDFKLIIYGEGSERKNLEKTIRDLDLSKNVLLPGVVNNVKNRIYNASVFVLSSDYEGMPNSLLEALSLGVPSISTDCPCGGPKMVISNNKDGILVPINDIESLSKAIIKLSNDLELQQKLSIASNQKMKKFHPDIINKEWEDYFYDVIKCGDV